MAWSSIAGQVGADRDGVAAEGAANQVVQAFANVRLALEAKGLEPTDLLQLTTYLITPDEISAFYEARAKVFAEMFPNGGYPPNTLLRGSANWYNPNSWSRCRPWR